MTAREELDRYLGMGAHGDTGADTQEVTNAILTAAAAICESLDGLKPRPTFEALPTPKPDPPLFDEDEGPCDHCAHNPCVCGNWSTDGRCVTCGAKQ